MIGQRGQGWRECWNISKCSKGFTFCCLSSNYFDYIWLYSNREGWSIVQSWFFCYFFDQAKKYNNKIINLTWFLAATIVKAGLVRFSSWRNEQKKRKFHINYNKILFFEVIFCFQQTKSPSEVDGLFLSLFSCFPPPPRHSIILHKKVHPDFFIVKKLDFLFFLSHTRLTILSK